MDGTFGKEMACLAQKWRAEKSWEKHFLRGQIKSIFKYKGYLETRQDKISNELSWAQFGHRKGTQNLAEK